MQGIPKWFAGEFFGIFLLVSPAASLLHDPIARTDDAGHDCFLRLWRQKRFVMQRPCK